MGTAYVSTPIGTIGLVSDGTALVRAFVAEETDSGDGGDAITALAARLLSEYFRGVRQSFDLPLCPKGTAFERRVWQALLTVPYGVAKSYGEIAVMISMPRACRAVGRAVGKNPLLVFIPCHRVLAAGGRLGGFSAGIERKKILLLTEKIFYSE